MDARIPFDEALPVFREFLCSQGWSTSLLWLSRDRVTGLPREYWIYRPEDLQNVAVARRWYEDARKENWNLRIDGFAQHHNSTLAYVERGPGRSRALNFGVATDEVRLHVVRSASWWKVRRAVCRLRGESPILLHTEMPTRAEPTY
jgi:hypothetical protein